MDAETTIAALQRELRARIEEGAGPFMAEIRRADGTLVARAANSVVADGLSTRHAEINAIEAAERALGTDDLSGKGLSLYVTAEPCMMCLGAILWSGIERVYWGVPSKRVEELTGFDEGHKPDWERAFAERGIRAEGGFALELGEAVLGEYAASGRRIYRPHRAAGGR